MQPYIHIRKRFLNRKIAEKRINLFVPDDGTQIKEFLILSSLSIFSSKRLSICFTFSAKYQELEDKQPDKLDKPPLCPDARLRVRSVIYIFAKQKLLDLKASLD